MTEGERGLIIASCARAAELWSNGNERGAERWFGAALEMIGMTSGEFIDTDQEADR
jgi:hypothetical protein